MEFFDCNACYGHDRTSRLLKPVLSVNDLNDEMERAGVGRAVVFRTDQYLAEPDLGNRLLADDLQENEHLYGLWALTPVHTGEIPGPDNILAEMKRNRIIGFRLFPESLHYLPRAFVLREWLDLALKHRIPLFVNTAHGCSLDALADILEQYPDLTVVLTDPNVWPRDRMLRPFVAGFPNVYLDLSYMITAGGIESFVAEYGASRLLYGSAFPKCYFGANMLMIRHADISQADCQLIAAGNLERIIREIAYD
ncbi:MAG: amidohydrolase family protein [Bacillota bacterium]|nr:amidohydrolase family protein [Bacillota bacterium]